MSLRLPKDLLQKIRRQGENAFPYECCGFLLGSANGESRTVDLLQPAVNEQEDAARHNRFLITAENYLVAQKQGAENNAEILGFYHSHPNAPARPSQYDEDHAWPWYSYVIVSVREGAASDTTSWVLRDDRSGFDEQKIESID